MLAKIIFLSFFSIIPAHRNVNKPCIQEVGTGDCCCQGDFIVKILPHKEDQPLRKRPKLGPSEKPSTLVTGVDIVLHDVKNQKLLDIKENWGRNPNRLNSLQRDSMKLLKIRSEMMKDLKTIQCSSNSIGQLRILNLHHDIEGIMKFYDQLETLKQRKLLEIGKADLPNSNSNLLDVLLLNHKEEVNSTSKANLPPLPEEVVSIIAQKTWRNAGNDMINELKHLIIYKKLVIDISPIMKSSLFRHSCSFIEGKSMLWLRFAFSIVDFLFENNFVDQNIVRIFFQDPVIIDQVIKYAESRFNREIGETLSFGKTYNVMTEHWYWPHLHKSVKALGKKEEDILNSHLLLGFRHKRFLRSKYQGKARNPDFESAVVFLREFNTKWYLSELRDQEYSKDDMSKFHQKDNQREKHITSDIFRIMEIIENSGNGCWGSMYLRRHLYDILDFIEQKISPGIISTGSFSHEFTGSLSHQKLLWNFDNRFNISKIIKKISRLYHSAIGYHQYIKLKFPSSWLTSRLHKSKFNDYLFQLIDLHGQISVESLRLFKKLGNTQDYYQLNHEIERIVKKLDKWITNL